MFIVLYKFSAVDSETFTTLSKDSSAGLILLNSGFIKSDLVEENVISYTRWNSKKDKNCF